MGDIFLSSFSFPPSPPPILLSSLPFSFLSAVFQDRVLGNLPVLYVPGFLASTSQVWDYRCAPEHSA